MNFLRLDCSIRLVFGVRLTLCHNIKIIQVVFIVTLIRGFFIYHCFHHRLFCHDLHLGVQNYVCSKSHWGLRRRQRTKPTVIQAVQKKLWKQTNKKIFCICRSNTIRLRVREVKLLWKYIKQIGHANKTNKYAQNLSKPIKSFI